MENNHLNTRKVASSRRLLVVQIMLGASALFFITDVAWDAIGHIADHDPYSTNEVIHTFMEFFAVVSMLVGVYSAYCERKELNDTMISQGEKLEALLMGVESKLKSVASDHSLTNSETDVLTLTVKGMSIQEIADARQVAGSTVKVQLSSIYRKLSVKSRSELLSKLLDEYQEIT